MLKKSSLSIIGMINIAISVLVALATYASLALIARKFGASSGSDAYFYLLSLTTVTTALVGSVLSAVFLPVFVDIKVRHGSTQAYDFASTIFSWTILVGVLVGVAVYLGHARLFGVISKFDEAKLAQQKSILILFGPVFFVTLFGEYLRVLLVATGQYTAAALGALAAPTILAVALLFSGEFFQEQTLAVTLFLARLVTLMYLISVCFSSRIKLNFTLMRTTQSFRFIKTAAPYGIAGFVTHFATFFFDYMATGLTAGVLTSVSYAQRVFALPLTLVVTPLLEIARVKFSEYRAIEDVEAFQKRYEQLSKIVFYFSIPIAFVFYLFSEQIISMLFKRGEFSQSEVAVSAACLRVFAWSIPFYCFFTLNGRAVESFQRLLWPSVFGTFGNLVLIVLTYYLVGSWGFLGIPYARVAIDVVYFFPMGAVALATFGIKIDIKRLSYIVFTSGVACLLSIFIPWSLQPVTDNVQNAAPHAYIVAMVLLSLFAYIASLAALDGDLRRLTKSKFMGKTNV